MRAQLDEEFRDFMHGRWPAMVRLAYALTGDQHELGPGGLDPGERGDRPIGDRPVAADDRPVEIGRHQQRPRWGVARRCATKCWTNHHLQE